MAAKKAAWCRRPRRRGFASSAGRVSRARATGGEPPDRVVQRGWGGRRAAAALRERLANGTQPSVSAGPPRPATVEAVASGSIKYTQVRLARLPAPCYYL